MATIVEKQLREALAKAKDVGVVEERFEIQGCELVLRNLRPEEYSAALRECEGLDPTDYLVRFQKSHISRAIVEVNGVDLREVGTVTVEQEDPRTHQPKNVRLELHKYLEDHLLKTWSREAIYLVMRKFYDVVEAAERKSREGINFLLPEETDEERYRRLMGEAASIEKDVPPGIVEEVLGEMGLMRRINVDETDGPAEEAPREDAAEEPIAPASEPDPEPESPAAPEPPARSAPGVRVADPHLTLQQAIAARLEPPAPAPAAPPVPGTQAARASRIAEIEGAEEGLGTEVYAATPEPVEVRRVAPVDVGAAVIDPKPVAGINPRFRGVQKV